MAPPSPTPAPARFPPLSSYDASARERRTAASDLDGTLLPSSSAFPYYFLVALEAGSYARALALLLLAPFILLLYTAVSEPAAIELGLPDDGYNYLAHIREFRPFFSSTGGGGSSAAFIPSRRRRPRSGLPVSVKMHTMEGAWSMLADEKIEMEKYACLEKANGNLEKKVLSLEEKYESAAHANGKLEEEVLLLKEKYEAVVEKNTTLENQMTALTNSFLSLKDDLMFLNDDGEQRHLQLMGPEHAEHLYQ